MSSHPGWTVLTLEVQQPHADAVADDIRERSGLEPVAIDRPGALHTWLELYFDDPQAAHTMQLALHGDTRVLASTTRRCDPRDWATFWQLHFRAHRVGKRLEVCPVWEQDRAIEAGRTRLLMVPGLSFGTGDHFTTRFCLEMIDQHAPPGPCRTMWDAGCGSGILAVAGALLGMERVLGTDNDPVCLGQAAENATLNGVADRADWLVSDITRAPTLEGPYDLVCANLFASLLMLAAPALWESTGQCLALSGIREFEVDAVSETFVQLGAREMVRDGDGEWAGLLFRRG